MYVRIVASACSEDFDKGEDAYFFCILLPPLSPPLLFSHPKTGRASRRAIGPHLFSPLTDRPRPRRPPLSLPRWRARVAMPIDAQGLKADSIRQSVSNSLFDEFQTWIKWYESRAVLGYGYLASLRSLFVIRCNGRRSTATGVARFGLSDIMSLSPCLTREKDFFMPCLSGCRLSFLVQLFWTSGGHPRRERRRHGDIGGWATPMSMAGPATDRPTRVSAHPP